MQARNKSPSKIPLQGAGRDKYGLHAMLIGQEKFLPLNGITRASIARAVTLHGKRHGKRFVTRIWSENDIIGIRVFRTE